VSELVKYKENDIQEALDGRIFRQNIEVLLQYFHPWWIREIYGV